MKNLAKKHEFEKAGETKRKIFALNHIQDIALIKGEGEKPKVESGIRIEAYDIAHISGTNTVGVMVVVSGGKPDKNEYRKFNIRLSKQNDIAGLEEVLKRRLKHPEWRFPDIIVVDGGIAQKSIAQKVLSESGLLIPAIAVTKDERHRPKTIQGREDLIEKNKKEILLANSESHRFAIKFHREKRSKLV